jgi:two-component system, chemotaxis family, sensor histidine kinase and response regulator PixL
MSQDKELEIKLQFLDEAQEYLRTLESALLGLASRRIDPEEINAALRAAHSIKGGAGMMGFGVLSQLAHRLEDSFKVLKIQKQTVEIDGELERLLLSAVDCLGEAIVNDHNILIPGSPVTLDLAELTSRAEPIFDRLSERLGDPQDEDASSILLPEDGQDVILLLFETEVEGCLERLESVLANPDLPCLQEELAILAQELGGLGEMLQIEAFGQLCVSVGDVLNGAPDRVEEIAHAALASWRRSQALILTGQFDLLPTAIEISTAAPVVEEEPFPSLFGAVDTNRVVPATEPLSWLEEPPETEAEPQVAEVGFNGEEEVSAANLLFLEEDETIAEEPAPESLFPSLVEDEFSQTSESFSLGIPGEDEFSQTSESFSLGIPGEDEFSQTSESFSLGIPREDEFSQTSESFSLGIPGEDEFSQTSESFSLGIPREDEFSQTSESFSLGIPSEMNSSSPDPSSVDGESPSLDLRSLDLELDDTPSTPEVESPDTTVRVSVKRLEQLNDLLGELIIERNGLDLQFNRLRGLVGYLGRRVQSLEQSTAQLQLESNKTPFPSQSFAAKNDRSVQIDRSSSSKDARPEFDLLELDRYNDSHLRLVEVLETVVQIQEVTGDIELSVEDTEQTTRNLNKTVKQLQTNLNQVRMRPLSDIFERFPRALRELSLQHSKPINLKISGGRTLVDRNILEVLHDPLMHLLRNAFDHGIEDAPTRRAQGKSEQGTIEIHASHQSNRTLITLRDDGGGIPLDKIRARAVDMGLDAELLNAATERDLLSLIFEPGFSTKDQVSDLSGRGVGMDVVRNNLKQVRGEIQVETKPGQGTTFTLWLPFTLSISRVLVAESSGMLMAFPSDTVREIVSPLSGIAITADGSELLYHDGIEIPLVRPDRWIEFRCPHPPAELETPPTISTPTALIVDRGDQRMALVVNRCWSEQEVAIRQVEGQLPLPPGFASCTILGNGRIVPLVNVPELLNWIASQSRSRRTPIPTSPILPSRELMPAIAGSSLILPLENNTILIVDDSINVRRFLALTLEKAGYRVEQARDGQDALDKLFGGLNVRAAICDIEMPRLDGYGFLAQVKSQETFKDLPVVMLTSRTGSKHRQLALSLGATAYFSKPYNEQTLLQTLETVTSEPTPAY